MRHQAEWTVLVCASALMVGSLVRIESAAFAQSTGSYTQCHTYIGGGTVYTSKPVPHEGDARTWLAPFQAYITQRYGGQANGGRCLSAESVEAAKARLPQGPKIIETDWTYTGPN
jgi:hypothetical protein